MGEVYWEENHDYQIDLRNAAWSLELQPLYREYNLSLADVDWICEFNGANCQAKCNTFEK